MIPRKRLDVEIRGLSVAVPKNTVEVPEGRFKKLTGIERRRICPSDMYMTDLAEAAVRALLKENGWKLDSIGSIIVVTQTPDMAVPSSACLLHGRLDLPQTCAAFDVNQGCSGYPYGLAIAGGFVDYDNPRSILVVGEITGKLKQDTYAPMFGDAVSATALEFSPNANLLTELMTNGKRWDAITERYLHGRPNITIEDGKVNTHYNLKGEDVYQFSVREAPAAINRMVEISGKPLSDIDGFIFHQANKMINDKIKKRLKLKDDQVPTTLKDFGNTSSATIPLTLHQGFGKRLRKETMNIMMCGFGVGLSWGTACVKLGAIACPDLVEL